MFSNQKLLALGAELEAEIDRLNVNIQELGAQLMQTVN
jgi:hypothetical protein